MELRLVPADDDGHGEDEDDIPLLSSDFLPHLGSTTTDNHMLHTILDSIHNMDDRLESRLNNIGVTLSSNTAAIRSHSQQLSAQARRIEQLEQMVTMSSSSLGTTLSTTLNIPFEAYKLLIECAEHVCGFGEQSVIIDHELLMKLVSYKIGKNQREARRHITNMFASVDLHHIQDKPDGMLSDRAPWEIKFDAMLDLFQKYFDQKPVQNIVHNLNIVINGKRKACKLIRDLRDMDAIPRMQSTMGVRGVQAFIDAFGAKFPGRSVDRSNMSDINILVRSGPPRR